MIKPIGNKILVEVSEPEKVTKSGVILPDAVSSKVKQGKVIAIGTGRILECGKLIEINISVNDTVFYPCHLGIPIEEDKVNYVILDEREVLGVKL